jgi:4-aminobutyrate--pyruvate transaminase
LPIIRWWETTGVGMLAVAELVADKTTKKAFDPACKIGAYLTERALEQGLIIRSLGDRIGFSPPLVIDKDQIVDMYDRFGRALEETRMWVENN